MCSIYFEILRRDYSAHESAAGASGLKDELDENVILKQLNIIVGEWIPFGANQIVALNEKLGSTDRCRKFTSNLPLLAISRGLF